MSPLITMKLPKGGYGIFDLDSKEQIGGEYVSQEMAELSCANNSKNAKETTKTTRRKCLFCDQMIDSEGPHHRMCMRCRQSGHDLAMI